jgi:hypothetical protein
MYSSSYPCSADFIKPMILFQKNRVINKPAKLKIVATKVFIQPVAISTALDASVALTIVEPESITTRNKKIKSRDFFRPTS